MSLAPILVLGYKRPAHLRAALGSLASNPEASESLLYIAIDGARTEEERRLVEECRFLANSISGFKQVITNFQDANIGLAGSVISNVSRVLSAHGKIIVVEDDLVVSAQFLAYMNSGLDKYEDALDVASIHGFQYPIRKLGSSCVFLRGADCWGWGTWKNRWDSVNFSAIELVDEILNKKLKQQFDLLGVVPNFQMLQDQASNRIDSWAIRWHASMYLQNKLTLFPPTTLVKNCGLDGSGTHEGVSRQFDSELPSDQKWVFPVLVQESRRFKVKLFLFYFCTRFMRFLNRIRLWPNKLVKRIIKGFR